MKGVLKTQLICSFSLSLSPLPPLDHPIMMGFEPLVNQRLLPPTFPRYAKIIKREEMVNYFSKLIDRIKTVCEVVNLTNLHCILVSMNISYLLPKKNLKMWLAKKNHSICACLLLTGEKTEHYICIWCFSLLGTIRSLLSFFDNYYFFSFGKRPFLLSNLSLFP